MTNQQLLKFYTSFYPLPAEAQDLDVLSDHVLELGQIIPLPPVEKLVHQWKSLCIYRLKQRQLRKEQF